jgi:hypothetical protein
MAITQLDYPVTGTAGNYSNLFPSQKPLNMNFNRQDGTILSLVSGVDNNVRLAINETFENVVVGQTVVFSSDGYSLRSSQIVSIIDTSTIEVNVLFDSSDATNGFINYHENWFLEVRYVDPDSTSSNQSAIEILEDYSQIPSALNGLVVANIALPADMITGNFSLSGIQANLFIEYKIQYRQSYKGQRTLAWVSPTVDVPILLVHATVDLTVGFTDLNLTKRYIKGYPLNYFVIYSDVNDAGSNQFKVTLNEYGIDKALIEANEIDSITNLNGVYNLLVDTTTINVNTRFLEFTSQLVTSAGQYDPSQYNPAQYA